MVNRKLWSEETEKASHSIYSPLLETCQPNFQKSYEVSEKEATKNLHWKDRRIDRWTDRQKEVKQYNPTYMIGSYLKS